MAPVQRDKFLANSLPEHDKLLNSQGYKANEKYQPGVDSLTNNPSKAYFNNAGIAGSGANQQDQQPGGDNPGGRISSQGSI